MSNLPKAEETIGKHRYTAHALPMDRWEELGEFLAGVLGQPAADLVRGFESGSVKDMFLDGDEAGLARILGLVESKMTAANLRKLREFMGLCLHVDDRPLDAKAQNMWWAHNRSEYGPTIGLFLKAQYADFFSGFAAMLPTKNGDAETQPSTKTSAGSDDESPSI